MMLLLVVLSLGLRPSSGHDEYPLLPLDPHDTLDAILAGVPGDSLGGRSPDISLKWQLEDGPAGSLDSEGGVFHCSGLERVGGVVSTYHNGNLSIRAMVTFTDLRAKHTLNIRQPFVSRQIVYVTSPGNRFKLSFTIFSNPRTGQCDVDLGESSFDGGALRLRLRPTGFFNQLDMTASLDHITGNYLPRLFDVSREKLRAALQEVVCAKVSNYDHGHPSKHRLSYSNEEINESWEIIESGEVVKSREVTESGEASKSRKKESASREDRD